MLYPDSDPGSSQRLQYLLDGWSCDTRGERRHSGIVLHHPRVRPITTLEP